MKEFLNIVGTVGVLVAAPIICLACSMIIFAEGLRQSLASDPLTMPMAFMLESWMYAPYSGSGYLVDEHTVSSVGSVPIGVPIAAGTCGFENPKGYSVPSQLATCMRPVQEPAGTYGHKYGQDLGGYCKHMGIDFSGRGCSSSGCAVYAVMGGRVVLDGWSPIGFGHLIIIENQGWQFYYAHLTCGLSPCEHRCADGWEPEFKEGDLILTGQRIGTTGETSWVIPRGGGPGYTTSDGVHLHFEIHYCENGECSPAHPGRITPPGLSSYCRLWES